MWIIYGLLVHLALFASVYVIYLRSPVITGLKSQESLWDEHLEAPAKRLVLIVTDGLRAESAFHRNCSDIPHIRSVVQRQGLAGISHTGLTTESRPCHVALAAGFNEDPSAVTRGWKENPVDFDSVFNHSTKTFAWGLDSSVDYFCRNRNEGSDRYFTETFDWNLVKTYNKTWDLDNWVVNHVTKFLKHNATKLRDDNPIVFTMLLYSSDIAGHRYLPGSDYFVKSLYQTDKGIFKMYQEFERTFPDGRTAYVLTSDHGMADNGHHGGTDITETETPLFVWGAGVKRGDIFHRREIKQIQIASLISALLGLAPPKNNMGKLPYELLDVSAEYGAYVAHSNALQLLEQFNYLLKEHSKGIFSKNLQRYDQLDACRVQAYKRISESLIAHGEYAASVRLSYETMDKALEGTHYYHNYYRNVLLASCVLTIIGWMIYMIQLLLESGGKEISAWSFPVGLCIAGITFMFLCFLQAIPCAVIFYLCLPFVVWSLPVGKGMLKSAPPLSNIMSWQKVIMTIVFAELLALALVEWKLISLCFILFACTDQWRLKEKFKTFGRIILIVGISIAPFLCLHVGNWGRLVGIGFILARPLLSKWQLSYWRMAVCGLCFLSAVPYRYMTQYRIPILIISCCFMVYIIGSVLLCASTELRHRLQSILVHITSLYALICSPEELLFILALTSELMLALSEDDEPSPIDDSLKNSSPMILKENVESSFHFACRLLLYTLMPFFGVGNLASLATMNKEITTYLTIYSRQAVLPLNILKRLLAMIANVSIILAGSAFVRSHRTAIGMCAVLICDLMGLNFIFFVRNTGSWMQMGISIARFGLTQATAFILMLLIYIAEILLKSKAVAE